MKENNLKKYMKLSANAKPNHMRIVHTYITDVKTWMTQNKLKLDDQTQVCRIKSNTIV